MEYLPIDPTELESKNKEKTEKKLKEFREYIVEKGVVLAFVKVLLSLKYAEQKPKNPIKAIREFFGKYRDPRWDEVEALKEKIIIFTNENEKLQAQALELEDQLKNITREKRMNALWGMFELDKNGLVSTKTIIEKLTGNKKFDVDEKLDQPAINLFIESITEKHSYEENELMSKLETALTEGEMVYKEDIENPLYLKIVDYFRELKKTNKESNKK